MVDREVIGCIKKGLESDLPPHGTYLNDYLFYATDTGNLYWNNGTAWVLFSGPQKSEVLKNKFIDTANNTMVNMVLDPFISRKREGSILPALTADGSLKGALKGLPSVGTYSYFYPSSVDGYCSRFSTSAIQNIGYYPNGSTFFFTKRRLNPKLKVRVMPSTVSASRLYIGFANVLLPSSNAPLGNTDSGILLGYHTGSTSFSIFRNDGTGPTTTTTFPVSRAALFTTFEITMSNTNIIVSINDSNYTTYTTFIPALDTLLYPYIQYQSTDTTAKSLDINKGLFTSDI